MRLLPIIVYNASIDANIMITSGCCYSCIYLCISTYMQCTNYNAYCPLGYIITYNTASMLSESKINDYRSHLFLPKTKNKKQFKNNTRDCAIIRNMPLSAIYFIVFFFLYICRYIYLTHQESGSPIGANKFFCFNCKSNIYMNIHSTQASAEQA